MNDRMVAVLTLLVSIGTGAGILFSSFKRIECLPMNEIQVMAESSTFTTATTPAKEPMLTMSTTQTTSTAATTQTTSTTSTMLTTETTKSTSSMPERETTVTTTVEVELVVEEEPAYGSDAYLLAYAMAREAADYTDALYVGNVILNRVDDPDFPDTILEVLQAPGQYPWGDAYYSREYIYDTEFFKIAEDLLSGGTRPLPSSVVYQAQFVQGSGIYCTYGVHYYCCK